MSERCNAEIGKPGSWRQCPRRARWSRGYRDVVGIYIMYYCDRHKDRLTSTRATGVSCTDVHRL